VDGQCGKLVTVIGHQFIIPSIGISVQHGGRWALRRAGLSAAAETCKFSMGRKHISGMVEAIESSTFVYT